MPVFEFYFSICFGWLSYVILSFSRNGVLIYGETAGWFSWPKKGWLLNLLRLYFFVLFPVYTSSEPALPCILMQVFSWISWFSSFVSFICLWICWREIGRFGKEIVNRAALPLHLILLFVYSIYNTILVKPFVWDFSIFVLFFMIKGSRKSDCIRGGAQKRPHPIDR